MSSVLKYWPIFVLVIQLGLVWICWSLRQLAVSEVKKLIDEAVANLARVDKEAEDALDDHESRITVLTKDVEAIRAKLGELPTKEDLAELRGEVRAGNVKIESIDRGMGRLEGYFLQLGVERAS